MKLLLILKLLKINPKWYFTAQRPSCFQHFKFIDFQAAGPLFGSRKKLPFKRRVFLSARSQVQGRPEKIAHYYLTIASSSNLTVGSASERANLESPRELGGKHKFGPNKRPDLSLRPVLAKAVAAAHTAKEKSDKSGAASRKGEKYNIASGGSFVLGGVTRRHVAPLALLTLR
jgi:hypothetical protein